MKNKKRKIIDEEDIFFDLPIECKVAILEIMLKKFIEKYEKRT